MHHKRDPNQTGFLDLFDQHAREQATANLPGDLKTGIAAYRTIIERFHAAMLVPDLAVAEETYNEAHALAVKLNGGTSFGIIADRHSPGCALARETAAPAGEVL